MSTASKSVFIVGLGAAPAASAAANTKWTLEKLHAAVNAQLERAKAAGFEPVPYFIDPSSPTAMDDLRVTYTARKWDGASIGFGVRGMPENTALFENIVNLFVHEQTPPPKMIFSEAPDAVCASLERAWPGSFKD